MIGTTSNSKRQQTGTLPLPHIAGFHRERRFQILKWWRWIDISLNHTNDQNATCSTYYCSSNYRKSYLIIIIIVVIIKTNRTDLHSPRAGHMHAPRVPGEVRGRCIEVRLLAREQHVVWQPHRSGCDRRVPMVDRSMWIVLCRNSAITDECWCIERLW
jgi:hypothetical protein